MYHYIMLLLQAVLFLRNTPLQLLFLSI